MAVEEYVCEWRKLSHSISLSHSLSAVVKRIVRLPMPFVVVLLKTANTMN
jgi:hypothetical protein